MAPTAATSSSTFHRPRAADWLRLGASLLVLAGLALLAARLGYFDLRDPDRLRRTATGLQDARWIEPVFVIAYALIGALAMPVSPLAYFAGALFGFPLGAFYVWLASILGAAGGYYLARGLWHDSAKRLLGPYHEKLGQLHRGHPFLTTLRVQLLPIVPFGIFNYATAVSDMPAVPFLLGTALGIIPGTVAATFIGDRFMAGIQQGDHQALWIGTGVGLVLVALSFIPTLIERHRKRGEQTRPASERVISEL